jgi:hypothetical protein
MEVPQSIKIEIYPGSHRVGRCRSCVGNLKWKRLPRSAVSLKMREKMSHAWHGHRLKRKRKYSRYRPDPVLRSGGIHTVPSMVLFICLIAHLGLKRSNQPITSTSEEVNGVHLHTDTWYLITVSLISGKSSDLKRLVTVLQFLLVITLGCYKTGIPKFSSNLEAIPKL